MKKMPMMQRKALIGWIFCIPFLIGFFLFFLVPVVQTAILSFKDVTPGPVLKDVGWGHYYSLFFENAEYIPKLKTSITDLLINFPCILLFSFFYCHNTQPEISWQDYCQSNLFSAGNYLQRCAGHDADQSNSKRNDECNRRGRF